MNGSNVIRLREFCQFKKEIRGSAEYLIVGLDIGKEYNFGDVVTYVALWFSVLSFQSLALC